MADDRYSSPSNKIKSFSFETNRVSVTAETGAPNIKSVEIS